MMHTLPGELQGRPHSGRFDLSNTLNHTWTFCVPPEEAPVWSGRCPLWTAGPSSREQERPGSGGERRVGWEHRRAATGRETAGW